MARHNLSTVIGFEVRRTLKKRSFWLATILVPVVLAVVFALVFVSNSSTSDSVDAQKDAKFTFSYTDDSGKVNPDIVQKLGGTLADDADKAIADVKSGTLDAYFAYPADPIKQSVKVYAVDKGIFANGKYDSVATQVLQLSAEQAIGSSELTALAKGQVAVDTTTYKDGTKSGGFLGLIPPLLFLVIFYVVILLLGNQMLSSTLEEKESRVTEMILTTVNPTTLIVGKVFALFIVGIVQMLVFLLPVLIAVTFFGSALGLPNLDLSTLELDPQRMNVGALLLLGGFTLFTGTLVAIGAVMPTAKDAGGWFGALIALIFVPFYTVSLVVSDPNALIVQVFTYFPFSAPVTAMLRNAFGTLNLLEASIVIVELFGLGIIVIRIAVQLFQYGSIEYSRKVSLRTALARRK